MELKIDNSTIETLVKEQLRVAVGALLSQKSDALVQGLVRHALEAKTNSYDRETILDKKIAELIRNEATAAVKEWLDTKREVIRKQVFTALTKKDGLAKSVADQLVLGLGNSLRVSAYLNTDER